MNRVVVGLLSLVISVIILVVSFNIWHNWLITIGTGIGLVIVLYMSRLFIFKAKKPSSNEIDNVYYVGFLFTIGMLIFTTHEISAQPSDEWKNFIPFFTIGLSATAIALFMRLVLLSIYSSDDNEDDQKAIEFMRRLATLSEDFGNVSDNISTLAKNTQQRAGQLANTFDEFDKDIQTLKQKLKDASTTIDAFADHSQNHMQVFYKRLDTATAQFDQHLAQQLDASVKRNQAHAQALGKVFSDAAIAFDQHLDEQLEASVKHNQAHAQALGKVFSDAAIALDQHLDEQLAKSTEKFDAHMAEASRASLEKTAALVDAATQAFASAIDRVIAEANRIRQEAETISFKEAADAIEKLTAAASTTQERAEKIANRLESLDRLEKVLAQIDKTADGLAGIAQSAGASTAALSSLGESASRSAASLDAQFVELRKTLEESIADVARRVSRLAGQLESDADAIGHVAGTTDELGGTLEKFKQLADACSASLGRLLPVLADFKPGQPPDSFGTADEAFRLLAQIAETLRKIADRQTQLDNTLRSLQVASETLVQRQLEANGPPFPRHFKAK